MSLKASLLSGNLDFNQPIAPLCESIMRLMDQVKVMVIIGDINKCYNRECKENKEVERLKMDEHMMSGNPFAEDV